MKKLGVRYVCSVCGNVTSTWTGRCSNCGEWNSLEEQVSTSETAAKTGGDMLKAVSVAEAAATKVPRLGSGIADVDAVLGGGLVAGSVVLLAGPPGVGKSTLLLQVAHNVAAKNKVLYVSGEESARQVAMRAERLGVTAKNLQLAISTVANDVATTISRGNFNAVIIDSIQTMAVNEISSSAGTVSQITNATRLIGAAAKTANTALILVGHVTKEGSIAGPKVLEHMVDTVLQLEGETYGGFKIYCGLLKTDTGLPPRRPF